MVAGLGSVWLTLGFMMDEFPLVLTRWGVSLIGLEFDDVSDFTAGDKKASSLSDSTWGTFKDKTKRDVKLVIKKDFRQKSSQTLPFGVLGKNEVPMGFFFLSLSNNDINSSSELPDSSSAAGTENVRLGDAADAGVLLGGTQRTKRLGGKGGDGVQLSSSFLSSLALLDLRRGLGFEWRVFQEPLTTLLSSSSSLSLTKTGELNWDRGLLNRWGVVEVLVFCGTVKKQKKKNPHKLFWMDAQLQCVCVYSTVQLDKII